MKTDPLLAAIDGYYTEKVKSHGPTPFGVDWNGVAGQELRFEQLLDVIAPGAEGFSINDYGCGYGALLEPLSRRHREFSYTGYDLSEAMIDEARRRYAAASRASFTTEVSDLLPADFTVASGIFNVKLDVALDRWARHVHEIIAQMVRLSKCGIAFNALTGHADADRRRADLHYADPAELLDHCLSKYSRDVELRHNYELYEFTILVWLDRRPPASPKRGGTADE